VGIIAPLLAETDIFFRERRCLLEGSGAGSTVSVDAFCAADCRRAERLFPKDRVGSRRNQVPIAKTADLRAAINFLDRKTVF
jgi:hypothetical protein